MNSFPSAESASNHQTAVFTGGVWLFQNITSAFTGRGNMAHTEGRSSLRGSAETHRRHSESLNPLKEKHAEESPTGRIRPSIKHHRKITLGGVDAELRLVMLPRKNSLVIKANWLHSHTIETEASGSKLLCSDLKRRQTWRTWSRSMPTLLELSCDMFPLTRRQSVECCFPPACTRLLLPLHTVGILVLFTI